MRFNSQRDGILPYTDYESISYGRFQFPTGWNSTVAVVANLATLASFNSQRDGILRDELALAKNREQRFQFPTGWNSTF